MRLSNIINPNFFMLWIITFRQYNCRKVMLSVMSVCSRDMFKFVLIRFSRRHARIRSLGSPEICWGTGNWASTEMPSCCYCFLLDHQMLLVVSSKIVIDSYTAFLIGRYLEISRSERIPHAGAYW